MRFILSIDTEADFWKYIQSPFGSLSKSYKVKWHLNRLRGYFRYAKDREGIVQIVDFLKKNKIPANFNVVAHLYLKQCNGWPHFNEQKPNASWFFKKDWYYWDKGGDFKSKPGLYVGDFFEKHSRNRLFDFGIHNFAHECLSLENQAISDSIVSAAVSAAKSLGIRPVSASAPFNITEDIKSPETLYNSLKKSGIQIVRYMGYEDYPGGFSHAFRMVKPFKKHGLLMINGSNYFEGTNSIEKINSVILDIKNNLDKKEEVYCLCCHDFTFKSIKNLQTIFNEVLKWREEGKIKIITMKNLVK
jgi:peptidoglycan/xylan/chitin deacetylase (PgdA/CDA1 family)